MKALDNRFYVKFMQLETGLFGTEAGCKIAMEIFIYRQY